MRKKQKKRQRKKLPKYNSSLQIFSQSRSDIRWSGILATHQGTWNNERKILYNTKIFFLLFSYSPLPLFTDRCSLMNVHCSLLNAN